MATIQTIKNILSAIKNSAHSITQREISNSVEAAGITSTDVSNVVNQLESAGYVKLNSTDRNSYFTRQPKRELIQSFLDGTATLPGIHFDADPSTPVAPEVAVRSSATLIKSILTQINNAPEALDGDDLEIPTGYTQDQLDNMVTNLADAKVIKEDENKDDHWFTRKPMRTKIAGYLQGTVSEADLFDPEIKNLPEPVQAATAPVTPSTPEPTTHATAPSLCAPSPAPAPETTPAPTEDAPKPKRKHVRTRPLAVTPSYIQNKSVTVRKIKNGFVAETYTETGEVAIYVETLTNIVDAITELMA